MNSGLLTAPKNTLVRLTNRIGELTAGSTPRFCHSSEHTWFLRRKMKQGSDKSEEATDSIRFSFHKCMNLPDQAAPCVYFVKSGFAGVQTESNHRLIYTCAWASP